MIAVDEGGEPVVLTRAKAWEQGGDSVSPAGHVRAPFLVPSMTGPLKPYTGRLERGSGRPTGSLGSE